MKNKILLVCALALGIPSVVTGLMHSEMPMMARAEDEAVCELTFPDDNSANNKVGDYASTWTAKKGNYEFEIKNANNNSWNNDWAYIRFGSKSKASVGSITSKTKFSEAVGKIDLTIDKVITASVNSIKLNVYDDENLSNIVETIDLKNIEVGTNSFNITNPSDTYFYSFSLDCQKKSNGFLQVSKVAFYKVAEPSTTYSISFDAKGGTFNTPSNWDTITENIGTSKVITLPTKEDVTSPYDGLLELIGWTDGTNTYSLGEEVTISEEKNSLLYIELN